MPMRIEDISTELRLDSDGIYVAGGASDVSYAPHGHEDCYGVEDRSFWFRHRNRCICSVVKNNPYPAGALLDIGGGNGYVAQALASEGHEVVLLEPGSTGAKNAKLRRGLQHVVCATIEDAGFRPQSFSALGMFDVIEHINHDRAFLGQVSGLLKPGGRLYLTVPCHQWLWSQADVHTGHFRRHTRNSLESLLDAAFRIDYLGFYFRPLVLPQYLLRALPYKLGLNRNSLLSTESEHGAGRGMAFDIIDTLLRSEFRRIAAGKSIGFGASALVAATLKG